MDVWFLASCPVQSEFLFFFIYGSRNNNQFRFFSKIICITLFCSDDIWGKEWAQMHVSAFPNAEWASSEQRMFTVRSRALSRTDFVRLSREPLSPRSFRFQVWLFGGESGRMEALWPPSDLLTSPLRASRFPLATAGTPVELQVGFRFLAELRCVSKCGVEMKRV